jgi:hypothetical protein
LRHWTAKVARSTGGCSVKAANYEHAPVARGVRPPILFTSAVLGPLRTVVLRVSVWRSDVDA